jgi:outer membrane lipoprotein SlyB
MKQKLLKSLLPAVMTAALCLAGCTRSESIANEKSDSELIAQLKSLNDELLMEATPTRLTTRQYLEIASADLFGASRGGKRGAQIGTAVGALF